MASAQTLHHPVLFERLARGIGHGATRIFGGIVEFFSLLDHANRAAFEYDNLSHLSDKKLSEKGLTRDGIGKFVVDRL